MTSPKPLLIVLMGNTLADLRASEGGDFDDWIARGLGTTSPTLRIDAREQPPLPDPEQLAGVVLSGSHAMVTDRAEWSERLAAWLARCVEAQLPVLGICYGHQLLAHALGGRVDYRARGMELGTREVARTDAAEDDPLFGGLPARFPAHLVHSQSVLDLPPGATLLAYSADEPHQAYRVGRNAWGVQFHPEFSGEAMRGYIRHLQKEPEQAAALLAAVGEAPEAGSLLRRFGEVARGTSPRA